MVPKTRIKGVNDTGGIMLMVFWVQLAASFILWIGAGAVMARGSANLRAHALALSRNVRALRMTLLFACSPLGIFVPMWVVANNGGAKPDALLPWAWLVITLGGLICVVCATLGLAYAVSLAMEAARDARVTSGPPAASSNKDSLD